MSELKTITVTLRVRYTGEDLTPEMIQEHITFYDGGIINGGETIVEELEVIDQDESPILCENCHAVPVEEEGDWCGTCLCEPLVFISM